MRIISGKFRHRKLIDCKQFHQLRPTTDANREALFNILTNGNFLAELDFSLIDSQILDLCCGTGAVAFEAISRGAKSATLIDNNSQHLTIAKQNAQNLGIVNDCQFILADVNKLIKNQQVYDLIFVDPPYHFDYQIIINQLILKNYLSQQTLLVIEHDKKDPIKNSNKTNNNHNNYFNKKNFEQKSNQLNHQTSFDFPSEDDLKKLNLKILQRRIYGISEFIFLKYLD